MRAETLSRDPLWCHDCGTWSFAEDWGRSFADDLPDVCPECGHIFPGMFPLPDDQESYAKAYAWASKRAVNW